MPVAPLYQMIKDFAELVKMKEVDPIQFGKQSLVDAGIATEDDADQFSWSRPDELWTRTEGPNAPKEIVWMTDNLRRTKRKVVRLDHSGALNAVLIRRRSAPQ